MSRANQKVERCSAANNELLQKLKLNVTKSAKKGDREAQCDGQTPPAAAPATQDETKVTVVATSKLQGEVEALSAQLASREQENLALLQSMSEIKDELSRVQNTLSETENLIDQAKEEHQQQLHNKEIEHVNSLNSYMDQVNNRLQKLESDNSRLVAEKQGLEVELKALEDDITRRKAAQDRIITVCEKSTETNAEDLKEMAELTKKEQDLAARICLLETRLTQERTKYESVIEVLQKSKDDESRTYNERETRVIRVYEEKSRELEDLKVQLQNEFDDFKASNDEAVQESERRILFLSSCVEECSRLVDSPRNERVTTRDIYDTVVALSKNLVVAAPKKNQRVNTGKRTMDARVLKKAQSRVVLPDTTSRMQPDVPQANREGRDLRHRDAEYEGHPHYGARHPFDNSNIGTQIWTIRAAKLEQQLRAALLKSSNFKDTIRCLELQVEDLKAELKERMVKELTLTTKNGLLKAEVKSFKVNFATLSSRYNQVCDELQLRMDEFQAANDEMSRMRSAVQRKSELLAQNKVNLAQLKDELLKVTLKANHLAATVKSSSLFAQKAKEQMQMFQNLKRQLETSQAQEYQLAKEIETQKDRNVSSQARVKSLRAENSELRAKLSDLQKKLAVQGGEGLSMHQPIDSDTRRAAKVLVNTPASLQDEMKALRKRVLQKQQLVVGFKTKTSELETEIAHLRTKLFEASQTNRDIQADQVNQKEVAMRHVAAMKEEMEAIVSGKVYELDGLRASIYDSLEVFVHCGSIKRAGSNERPCARSPRLSEFSTAMNGSRAAISKHQEQLSDETMLNLRRWTDLSPIDLNALHLQHSEPKPKQSNANGLGDQLLSHVERVLEHTPDECRAEICKVLEFLIARERDVYGNSDLARSH